MSRLEQLVADGKVDIGWAIFLTNDGRYSKPLTVGSISEAFSMAEGHTLAPGDLKWARHAGAGTMKGRDKVLMLRGAYEFRWRPCGPGDSASPFGLQYLAVTAQPLSTA